MPPHKRLTSIIIDTSNTEQLEEAVEVFQTLTPKPASDFTTNEPRCPKLISQTYGEKPPNSFFYIIQNGDKIKAVHHGVRAALRIGAAVGLANSIRLFGSYLHY